MQITDPIADLLTRIRNACLLYTSSPKTMHSVENSYNLHYFRHNVKISQKNFIKMPKNTCNTGRRVL